MGVSMMNRETPRKLTTVQIKIENREKGIYVSSDDVPGLWLWGDAETVFEDIIPTIQELYRLNQGKIVDVKAVKPKQTPSERLAGIERIPSMYDIYEYKEIQSKRVNG